MAEGDVKAEGEAGAKGAAAVLRPASLAGDATAGFRPLARLSPPPAGAARAAGGARGATPPGDGGRRFEAWAEALMSRWRLTLRRLAPADFVFAAGADAGPRGDVHHTRVVAQSHERRLLLRPNLTLRLTLAASAPVEHRHTSEVFERTIQALRETPAAESAYAPAAQVFRVRLGRDEVERRYLGAATEARSRPGVRAAPARFGHERQEMVLKREGARAESRPAPRRGTEDEAGAQFRPAVPQARFEEAARQQPNAAWPDVGVLTDQVMRRMQQRLVAQRERMGRI